MSAKSPIIKEARKIVQGILDRIDNDDCNEEELMYFMGKANAHSKGYFKREDFVNYDGAMRILGIGNRVTVKDFLTKHGVKMQKVNNQRVGFLRSEVEALKEEVKKPTKRHKKAAL